MQRTTMSDRADNQLITNTGENLSTSNLPASATNSHLVVENQNYRLAKRNGAIHIVDNKLAPEQHGLTTNIKVAVSNRLKPV